VKFGCGSADIGECSFQTAGAIGFHIQKELIFPRAVVDRATLDLEQIHFMARERLKGSEFLSLLDGCRGVQTVATVHRVASPVFQFIRGCEGKQRQSIGVDIVVESN
jgi:hypothetical protein